MDEPLINDVADTAFMVAAYRAAESRRPDALFRDPLAERLAGERGPRIAAALAGGAMRGWSMVVRTVVIDELVQQVVERDVDTVLNLGAGLDARPYRMELPAPLRWIEVDVPRIIEWKEAKLAGETPRCRLERVALDLADTEARRELFATIDAEARGVLVLTEGVVPYLTVAEAGALADDLRRGEKTRAWIVDYFSRRLLHFHRRSGVAQQMRNAPFRFDPEDWRRFFAEHGWTVREMRYIPEEARRLGRPMPLPPLVRAMIKVRRTFMRRRHREQMMHLMGYALMAPG